MKNLDMKDLEKINAKIELKKTNGLDTSKENEEFRMLMEKIYIEMSRLSECSSADSKFRKEAAANIIKESFYEASTDAILLPSAAMEIMTPFLRSFFNEICECYDEFKKSLQNELFDRPLYDKLLFSQEVFDTFYQEYYFSAMNYFGNDNDNDNIPVHEYSSRDYSYELCKKEISVFVHDMDLTLEKFRVNIDKYFLFYTDKNFLECKDIIMTIFFLNFDILHLILSLL